MTYLSQRRKYGRYPYLDSRLCVLQSDNRQAIIMDIDILGDGFHAVQHRQRERERDRERLGVSRERPGSVGTWSPCSRQYSY